MHTCLRTCIRAYVRYVRVHTSISPSVRAYVPTYVHTYVRTYVRTYVWCVHLLDGLRTCERELTRTLAERLGTLRPYLTAFAAFAAKAETEI